MKPDHLAEIEAVLLCVSEARERAERLARELGEGGAEGAVATKLEAADRMLLGLHGDLMRCAYLGASAEPVESSGQLELSA